MEPARGSNQEHDTLIPVALDRLSVEDEADLSRMNGGRTTKLVAVLLVAAIGGAGALVWMKRADAREAYLGAATQARQLTDTKLASFEDCTVPSAGSTRIETKAQWADALTRQGTLGGRSYARVLGRCTPMLEELDSDLAAIKAPTELASNLQAVRNASAQLKTAVDGYKRYLTLSGTPVDEAQAKTLAQGAANAWQSVEQRQAELLAAAKAHAGR